MLALAQASGAPDPGAPVASPAVGDPLAPYRGRPVLSIDFEGVSADDAAELRTLVDIEPGFLLGGTDLQAIIKRLYALGRYADVRVYAKRNAGTVSLIFFLRATRQLGDVVVVGAKRANADELRAALRVQPGDEIDSRTAAKLHDRAVAHLRAVGFPLAQVEVVKTTAHQISPIDYEVRVSEGAPVRVASVDFRGAPKVPDYALTPLLQTRVGAVLREDALELDRVALLEAYRSRGFLRATVEPATVAVAGTSAAVSFVVRAGTRISIELFGNELFSDEELRAVMNAPQGPIRGADVEAMAERVQWHYRRLGRPGARVKTRALRDANADLTRYVLTIEEGEPTRVSEIVFEGSNAFSAELLADEVRATMRRSLGDSSYGPDARARNCLARQDGAPDASQPLAAACPPLELLPEDRWVPELYAQALEGITAIYQNLGFLAAKVGPAEPTTVEDAVRVRIPVVEGTQTFIRSVAFRGNEAFTASELLDLAHQATANRETAAPLAPGAPISSTAIEDARIAMVRGFREQGYLYARVFSRVVVSPDKQWAELEYGFEEGPQVRIERVLVRGNHYTREGLIRSRISLQPGDLYRLEQALADQRAVAALGVFGSVRVKLIDEERPAERKDLVAEVIERDRQPIEIAPGISTADGPRLQLSYSHINVLGTASVFTASAKVNRQVFFNLYGQYEETLRDRYDEFSLLDQLEREVRVGIRSPRLFMLPMDPSLRLDLVHERTNAISYSLDAAALIFGLDAFPSERVSLSLEPQVSLANLTCPERSVTDCLGAARSRRDGAALDNGRRTTFKIGPSITFDGRDNPFNPTSGLYLSGRAFYAVGSFQTGPLDEKPIAFTSVEGTVSTYVPLWGTVLALSARGGMLDAITVDIPIDERFFLGGRDTMRGFVERTLIPEDACVYYTDLAEAPNPNCAVYLPRTTSSPPVSSGGSYFVLLKTELRVPVTERVSLGLFVDAGNLWYAAPDANDLALRLGTGAGLRYATPVGALAVDFGVNPERRGRNAESTGQLHFSVGVF